MFLMTSAPLTTLQYACYHIDVDIKPPNKLQDEIDDQYVVAKDICKTKLSLFLRVRSELSKGFINGVTSTYMINFVAVPSDSL